LRLPYHLFLFFHISLATVGGVLGLITLWLAYKQRFFKHKRVGRVAAVIWLLTAPTGVLVYVLLYILYPGGQTKPVIDAIFGL
jgi:putative membrane protein